nr:unnamed protein product [Callosobruchus chinensis]
MSPQLHSYCVQ